MKDKWQELNNSYKREKCNKLRRKDKGQRDNISKGSSKLKEFKDKINKRYTIKKQVRRNLKVTKKYKCAWNKNQKI